MNQETEDIFSSFTAELWTTSESPIHLYHYTSIDGARSIIANGKKLWASSFETMNDNKELRHGLNIAMDEIPSFLKQISINALLVELTKNWDEFLQKETKNPKLRPYILCFTESHESKLHWNRYADEFKGVALEFKKISELKNSSSGFLVKVIYDEIVARDKFRKNLKDATDLFIKNIQSAQNLSEEETKKKLCDLFNAYIQIIFKFSLSLKEPSWAEEQEWRLVVFKCPENQSISPHGEIQYRTWQSELVDYLVVDTKICGYQLSRVKEGYHFSENSKNGFLNFLTLHGLEKV